MRILAIPTALLAVVAACADAPTEPIDAPPPSFITTSEVDESQGPVRDSEDAINRALSVIRNRIDEFGVAEPLIQKVGAQRIVVELAGIDDPARARGIVERAAFLEWRITP